MDCATFFQDSPLIKKDKGVVQVEEVVLELYILCAEGIDEPNRYPSVTKRIYQTFASVFPDGDRDDIYYTQLAEGKPNPRWNVNGTIPLGRFTHGRELLVEVVRYGSKSDPGTSTGQIVVGRTRIPLPKEIGVIKQGRFGLVRQEEAEIKGEGHIILGMKILQE